MPENGYEATLKVRFEFTGEPLQDAIQKGPPISKPTGPFQVATHPNVISQTQRVRIPLSTFSASSRENLGNLVLP